MKIFAVFLLVFSLSNLYFFPWEHLTYGTLMPWLGFGFNMIILISGISILYSNISTNAKIKRIREIGDTKGKEKTLEEVLKDLRRDTMQ